MSRITIVRHGETEWSVPGRHTGRKDLPLTPKGEEEARRVGSRLNGQRFARVFTSPLSRARRTCELAGFGDRAEKLEDLVEWDYGRYEGLRAEEIRVERPGWTVFKDGCPGGERLEDLVRRADRVIAILKGVEGDSLVFAHGHLLRVLALRWAGLPPEAGDRFAFIAGAICVLGRDAALDRGTLEVWNDTSHLR